MTFLELARNRYSCRNYLPRPVERIMIERVLEAGRVAPSAANLQPWVFYAFTEKEGLEGIRKVYRREWFRNAPCVILICGDHSLSWKRGDGKDHCDIDVAIATDHMTLQATDLGLATCWICNFDARQAREFLGLPESLEPAVILSLGYPADRADASRHDRKRKPLSGIARYR